MFISRSVFNSREAIVAIIGDIVVFEIADALIGPPLFLNCIEALSFYDSKRAMNLEVQRVNEV